MRDLLNATAIVVAGGKSSRLGQDKRWIELAGEPLIHRSVRLMREVFKEVVVSSNDAVPGLPTGVEVIPDDVPGLGPIAGIATCLRRTGAELVFAAACDAPFPSRALIEAMFPLARGVDAVVPETVQGLEPLFAFYRRESLRAMQTLLDAGNRQLFRVFDLIPTRRISVEELAGTGNEHVFLNINEPGDLDRAEIVSADGWEFGFAHQIDDRC